MLTTEQKQHILQVLPPFRQFLDSPTGRQWLEERNERRTLFATLLTPNALQTMTEIEFRQLVESLWASQMWGNKDYLVSRVIQGNGLDKLRQHLQELLWGKESVSNRYDHFRRHIKGMGPASITEILAFVHPDECGLWNDRSRRGLARLGLDAALPNVAQKYHIIGQEYEQVNRLLREIADLLRQNGFPDADLVSVDFLLYFVFTTVPEPEARVLPSAQTDEDYAFDHDEVRDKLAEVGSGLGFDAETEVTIARGARVDCVWSTRIANMGMVRYVFEVHRGGNMDGMILNLQRARTNPTVQRLVVIANTKNIRLVQGEIEMLPEEFRKSVSFMEAKDVLRAHELVSEVTALIRRLELVKEEFQR